MTPSPSGWGGDLLFATGILYAKSQWTAWSDPPFSSSNSAWKTPDLLPEPSRAVGLVAASAGLAILARRRSPIVSRITGRATARSDDDAQSAAAG